jgi:hypothetical protein
MGVGDWRSAGGIFFFDFRAKRVLGVVVACGLVADIIDGRRVGTWKIFHVGNVCLEEYVIQL